MLELTGQGVEQPAAVAVSERLSAWLAEIQAFDVTTPSRTYVLLKERGFDKSCRDDDSACLSEMGKALGVDVVIAGIFAKAGGIYTILLRVVDAASGTVLTTGYQEIDAPLDKILTEWTAKAAKQLETVINTRMSKFSVLKIKTVPQGATVMIDGKEIGKSDIILGHTLPGKYTLEIKAPTYTAVKESLTVEPQKTIDLSYQLKHTKAFADSVHSASVRRLLIRSLTGGLTVACGAAGYYYNHRALATVQNERDAKNGYLAAGTNSDFNGLYQQYQDTEKKTDKAILTRNLFYSLTGACAVGFAVSFFF